MSDPNAVSACPHFAQDGYNLNNQAKFTLIHYYGQKQTSRNNARMLIKMGKVLD